MIELETFGNYARLNGATSKNIKADKTLRINQKQGPLLVDVWQPRTAKDVTPILLIHGWGGSGSYWQGTAHALAYTAQVIVPDLPGTGRSQPVQPAQNMFDQVASLKNTLDVLEIDRVQIVGHSMGAAMALLLADLIPERVERMVLTSMCFFVSEKQKEIYTNIMKFIQLSMRFRPEWMGYLPGLPQMMATRYFYRIPNDPMALRQGLFDYLQLDFDTAVACANDATNPEIKEAGLRVQAPTLIIACRQDQVMPLENVAYTVERIPNCEVHWMEECGHLPMVEKPGEYMAILRDFLEL